MGVDVVGEVSANVTCQKGGNGQSGMIDYKVQMGQNIPKPPMMRTTGFSLLDEASAMIAAVLDQ